MVWNWQCHAFCICQCARLIVLFLQCHTPFCTAFTFLCVTADVMQWCPRALFPTTLHFNFIWHFPHPSKWFLLFVLPLPVAWIQKFHLKYFQNHLELFSILMLLPYPATAAYCLLRRAGGVGGVTLVIFLLLLTVQCCFCISFSNFTAFSPGEDGLP